MLKYLRVRSTVKWNYVNVTLSLCHCLFTDKWAALCADDGTAVLKDESLDTSSHLCSQNKVSSLDMNLGDPDVLETIWMKALENCSSPPLQNLLRKDGKLSSLYTTQGNLLCVWDLFLLFFWGDRSVCHWIAHPYFLYLLWSTLIHLSRQLLSAAFQKGHVCLDICMI